MRCRVLLWLLVVLSFSLIKVRFVHEESHMVQRNFSNFDIVFPQLQGRRYHLLKWMPFFCRIQILLKLLHSESQMINMAKK